MKLLEVSSHSGISRKNILLATDFSEASAAALPYAAAIGRRYGSQLHVVHMLSPAYIIPSVPDSPVTLTPFTKPPTLMPSSRWTPWPRP